MKQGMIMGNMDGSYRRGRAVVAGQSKSRKSSTVKSGRGTSAKAGKSKVTGAQSAAGDRGLYDENVQYDVSDGRSRVAQLLSQQQSVYSYDGDVYVSEGQSPSVRKTGQIAGEKAAGNSIPKTGQFAEEKAAENPVPKTGQISAEAGVRSAAGAGTVTAEQAAAEGETETDEEETSQSTDTNGYSESDIEYMERLLQSMRESRENAAKSRTEAKKSLTYNYRKVSGAIMRAKTRIQAGNALSSAKSELSSLKRKAGSGQYKDEELQIAINHANKMIRTARRKMSHLKLEEMQKKSDNDTVTGQERKNENIKKKEPAQNSTAIKADLDQQVLQLKKRLNQITKAEKNGHRRSENYDLLQADMEYLKRKIDLMKQDTTGQGSDAAQQNGMDTGTAGVIVSNDAPGVSGTSAAGTSVADTSAGAAGAAAATAESFASKTLS